MMTEAHAGTSGSGAAALRWAASPIDRNSGDLESQLSFLDRIWTNVVGEKDGLAGVYPLQPMQTRMFI
jgi:hypothetical protein